MEKYRAVEYTGSRAWEALDVAEVEGATVRLHWTDQPYVWHRNDGAEVFAVLDGTVDMHVREDGREHIVELVPGDICAMDSGDEHVAVPRGPARVLVVERKDSI